MSWAVGWDSTWHRDVGYGVPAWCDQPECGNEIDRGLSYVCGGEPYGGDGCGLYFCDQDLPGGMCARCSEGADPFDAKPDHPDWIAHKLTDESWATWRAENPDTVEAMRGLA